MDDFIMDLQGRTYHSSQVACEPPSSGPRASARGEPHLHRKKGVALREAVIARARPVVSSWLLSLTKALTLGF